jgi:hypothetical protein
VPLHWVIDSRQQLVTVRGEGKVTLADMEHYLQVVAGANALAYRKLYNGMECDIAMDKDELVSVGARCRSFSGRAVGPVAIVLPPEMHERIARLFGILAAAPRPLRIFTSLAAAQRWIDGFQPGGAR